MVDTDWTVIPREVLWLVLGCLAPEDVLNATLAVVRPVGASFEEYREAVKQTVLSVVFGHFWSLNCQEGEAKPDALVRCLRMTAVKLTELKLEAPTDAYHAARLSLNRLCLCKEFGPYTTAKGGESCLHPLATIDVVLFPTWRASPPSFDEDAEFSIYRSGVVAAACLLQSVRVASLWLSLCPPNRIPSLLCQRWLGVGTPVGLAVCSGDAGFVATLLEFNFKAEGPPYDWTPLISLFLALKMACETGCTRSVRVVLDVAARLGFTDELRDFLHPVDDEDCEPFGWACLDGHFDVIRLLVESDLISVDSLEAHDFSPLVPACYGGHLELAAYLVNQCHARLDSRRYMLDLDDELNALEAAICSGNVDLVRFLLDRGAQNHWLSHDDEIFVMFLALREITSSTLGIVKLLIERGYPVDGPAMARECGWLWIMVAKHQGQKSADLAELFLSRGVPPLDETSGCTCFKMSSLHFACRETNPALIRVLLQSPSHARMIHKTGGELDETPLHALVRAAKEFNNVKKERDGKGAESDASSERPEGTGAAADKHHFSVPDFFYAVKLLLAAGASVSVKNLNGKSPLQCLRELPSELRPYEIRRLFNEKA
jgi:ankyrin repeat protein